MSSLAKKLLIKPGTSWLFYNVPDECMQQLQPLPDGVSAVAEVSSAISGILFFSTKRAQLISQLEVLTPVIKDETVVWVCYPKKKLGYRYRPGHDAMGYATTFWPGCRC